MQHEEARSVWMRLNESYGWAHARLERIKRVLTYDGQEMDLLVQTPSSCPQALGSAPWFCCSWLTVGVTAPPVRGVRLTMWKLLSIHPAAVGRCRFS